MLATSAPYLAVMDADLQHDETIRPTMLATLKVQRLDLVVGTRFAGSGSAEELGGRRRALSRLGRFFSAAQCRART
jgi:dolichol-phosphate mannosyltransferase